MEDKIVKAIKVSNIFYKPYSKFNDINIYGYTFCEIIKSPNVYVIDSEDEITDNITFTFESRRYYLLNCVVHSSHEKVHVIECSHWEEKCLDE